MLVYRVQNHKGVGPYRKASHSKTHFRRDMVRRHDQDSRNHPLPLISDGKQICAFKNLKQLKRWFADYELKELAKEGYKIKRCKVKSINGDDGYQIVCTPIK